MIAGIKVAFIASLLGLAVLSAQSVAISAQTDKSWADVIAAKIDIDYAKFIEYSLTGIGSYDKPKFLGFRVTGTPQEHKAASFIADQMRAIGLSDVVLEPVPVDAWKLSGAWLTIKGGKTYTASSFGGVPGTDEKGITAEVVCVGEGLRSDYEGIDVKGKLALAYWNPDDVWVDMIAQEAQLHGALGVILYNPPGGTYGQAHNALQSFDGTYSSDFIPLITITKEAAADILVLMKTSTVKATMVSLVKMEPGTGWNTVGYIPGEKHPDEYLIFGAHHDAWFFGALDDTGGIVALMALAKAIKESGYKPDRTLVFTTHTAEEYGYTDAYYDWCIGAWWQITHTHPEWQSKAIAYFNLEGMAQTGAPLRTRMVQELKDFLSTELRKNQKELLPNGWTMDEVYAWSDQWTYAAAGVPSIYLAAFSDSYLSGVYHTQLDNLDLMDWGYLAKIITLSARMAVDLDQAPIQPYNFETRAKNLLDHLNTDLMKAAGIDPNRILDAAKDFLKAAQTFNRVDKKNVSPKIADAVQEKLREAGRILLSSFTALSCWDDTIYPHEQVELDVTQLRYAIEALQGGDATKAMSEVEQCSCNSYAPMVSYPVFLRDQLHHSPSWPKLAWGGQGHLAPFIDLWQEYSSLAYKAAMGITDFKAEIKSFKAHYKSDVTVYQQRINSMTDALRAVNQLIEEANHVLAS